MRKYKVAWFLALHLHLVYSAPSTLKVAICNPGSVPYVIVDNFKNISGFDLGNFCLQYIIMHVYRLDVL